jgi:hypothetical protein
VGTIRAIRKKTLLRLQRSTFQQANQQPILRHPNGLDDLVLWFLAVKVALEKRDIPGRRKQIGLTAAWQIAFLQLNVTARLIVRRNQDPEAMLAERCLQLRWFRV